MNKFKNVVIADDGITTRTEVRAKHDYIYKFISSLQIAQPVNAENKVKVKVKQGPLSKIIHAVKNLVNGYNKAIESYYRYLEESEAYGLKQLGGLQ